MSRTVHQLLNLAGKCAVVSGGSKGLGLQMAHALGEAGAKVLICSRKNEDLVAACDELRAKGIDAQWLSGNCAEERDIVSLAEQAVARLGHVDILVNNAGATWGSAAEDLDAANWDKVMDLNVRGYFLMSKEVARRSMIPQGSGRIINIASIAGLGGNPKGMNMIAYNTSKGAVINFTKTLGAEWGKYNINVNAILPGFFPTKMTRATIKMLGEDKMTSNVPLSRLGDSEDLKGVTLLFASDAGKHITGQCLAVDGGLSSVIGF